MDRLEQLGKDFFFSKLFAWVLLFYISADSCKLPVGFLYTFCPQFKYLFYQLLVYLLLNKNGLSEHLLSIPMPWFLQGVIYIHKHIHTQIFVCVYACVYIYIYIRVVCSVMVTTIGVGHGDPNSNPDQRCLHFT